MPLLFYIASTLWGLFFLDLSENFDIVLVMIEKLKKILEKNPNVEYIVLSTVDWIKLCG
jgi:hypothetical protein